MKILISADMEGITGVVNWDQVTPGHSEYERFRRLMTGDVNAAIQGAIQAGADEIIVTDAHDHGLNILIEELDPRARLIPGMGLPNTMLQGIDSTFDGVFFVGYHARAGTHMAVLEHTWSANIYNLWLNDTLVGEAGLGAAVCGHFGVPVLSITGDQTSCDQAMELLGPIEVAVVKQAGGRMSAQCLPPQFTYQKICEAAARAIARLRAGQAPAPYRVSYPVRVKIELAKTNLADNAELFPGLNRIDGRTVEYIAPDMLVAFRAFQVIDVLANG